MTPTDAIAKLINLPPYCVRAVITLEPNKHPVIEGTFEIPTLPDYEEQVRRFELVEIPSTPADGSVEAVIERATNSAREWIQAAATTHRADLEIQCDANEFKSRRLFRALRWSYRVFPEISETVAAFGAGGLPGGLFGGMGSAVGAIIGADLRPKK